jgi:hypothetical protein
MKIRTPGALLLTTCFVQFLRVTSGADADFLLTRQVFEFIPTKLGSVTEECAESGTQA